MWSPKNLHPEHWASYIISLHMYKLSDFHVFAHSTSVMSAVTWPLLKPGRVKIEARRRYDSKSYLSLSLMAIVEIIEKHHNCCGDMRQLGPKQKPNCRWVDRWNCSFNNQLYQASRNNQANNPTRKWVKIQIHRQVVQNRQKMAQTLMCKLNKLTDGEQE